MGRGRVVGTEVCGPVLRHPAGRGAEGPDLSTRDPVDLT